MQRGEGEVVSRVCHEIDAHPSTAACATKLPARAVVKSDPDIVQDEEHQFSLQATAWIKSPLSLTFNIYLPYEAVRTPTTSLFQLEMRQPIV